MVERLTSSQNPTVKLAKRLRSKRARTQSQLTLIDGEREVRYAQHSGAQLHTLFFCETFAAERRQSFLQGLDGECGVYELPTSLFRSISFGDRDANVLSIAHRPTRQLSQLNPLLERIPSLVIVADRIEKPGNLGALFRTADGCGASALVVCDPICEVFSPNTIRASQGTVFHVPTAVTTEHELNECLMRNGFEMIALRVDPTARDFYDATYKGKQALIVGNEHRGIEDRWMGSAVSSRFLPMRGVADSLNVSVAAAIAAYEICKQQRNATKA